MSTALIVFSDTKLAQLFVSAAKEESLKPLVCRDGAAAIAHIKRHGRPRLVITELSLPVTDGFSFLSVLAQMPKPETTTVVVVSAFVNLRARAQDLKNELHIRAILPTSLQPSRMLEFLRKAMGGQSTVVLLADSEAEGQKREVARLKALEKYGIIDDLPPDLALQHLLENTARSFGVSTALISIVTKGRQWFKGFHGIEGQLLKERGSDRDISFCTHVVQADSHAPLIVPNAALNPCFSENPMVKAGTIGSYVGAPLRTPEGHVVGTLCLIDKDPSKLNNDQVTRLQEYASKVAGELFRFAKLKN